MEKGDGNPMTKPWTKPNKKKMKLTFRLAAITTVIVAGTIGVCALFDAVFLGQYYILNKQKELKNALGTLNTAVEQGIITEDSFDVPFERMCNNGNINIMIIGPGGNIVRSSYVESQWFLRELNDLLLNDFSTGEVLYQDEKYAIQQITDSRMQSEYLVLYGMLSDGSYVYMRTALDSIREAAMITNRFFVQIGCVAVLLCMLVIIIVSRSISRPIKDLSRISREMKELNFEAQYMPTKHTTREVDELGRNMNELSAVLEHTISELKAANNELQVDIRKKEEIDEMRKEFLSNVSHELKTPLALIQGYAEGLKEGINDDPKDMEYYCDVIMDEADKMNTMVKKLLTLNQLEFGHEVIEMTRFNVTELIQGLMQSSALLASQAGVTMELENQEPAYVWGDEFKVEEVISNYLSNALHYASGEKRIRVFYTRRDECLRISVFNTGERIPEQDLDKIWIKFYKVDKARTREYGGSGIGLSIVKAIMDSFHQQCGVINHEDGVEFWLELECNK